MGAVAVFTALAMLLEVGADKGVRSVGRSRSHHGQRCVGCAVMAAMCGGWLQL